MSPRMNRRSFAAAALLVAALAPPATAGPEDWPFNGFPCGLDLQSTVATPNQYVGQLSWGPFAVTKSDSTIVIDCTLQLTDVYGDPKLREWGNGSAPGPAAPAGSEPAVVTLPSAAVYYVCTDVTWTWSGGPDGHGHATTCRPVVPQPSTGGTTLTAEPEPWTRGGAYVNTAGTITITDSGTGLPATVTYSGVFEPALGMWDCVADTSGVVEATCTPNANLPFTWGCHTMVVDVEATGGLARGTGTCADGKGAWTADCSTTCHAEQRLEIPTVEIRCVADTSGGAAIPPYTVTCVDPVLPSLG